MKRAREVKAAEYSRAINAVVPGLSFDPFNPEFISGADSIFIQWLVIDNGCTITLGGDDFGSWAMVGLPGDDDLVTTGQIAGEWTFVLAAAVNLVIDRRHESNLIFSKRGEVSDAERVREDAGQVHAEGDVEGRGTKEGREDL